MIVEANTQLPRTMGIPPDYPHVLHVDEVDAIVHDRPAAVAARRSAADRRRASNRVDIARSFITDGCTLQTGIGAVPSMVVSLLADEDGGDYGVHSEMFTTGLMQLHQAGKVTNARKGEFPGVSDHDVRARHARALRLARREPRRAVPAGGGGERAERHRAQPPCRVDQRCARRSTCTARSSPIALAAASTQGSAATRTSSRRRASSSKIGR